MNRITRVVVLLSLVVALTAMAAGSAFAAPVLPPQGVVDACNRLVELGVPPGDVCQDILALYS